MIKRQSIRQQWDATVGKRSSKYEDAGTTVNRRSFGGSCRIIARSIGKMLRCQRHGQRKIVLKRDLIIKTACHDLPATECFDSTAKNMDCQRLTGVKYHAMFSLMNIWIF
ncbi:hypothetical protein HELRODRAFT_161128 [Helobdella robusta]|uniref:Uncharacterized protein n=1 Tax=Helobdella robusta TaxID=6412 RepID=T1ER44_HELRO|nr:hypothetical protein HELRODRAFT_161128 [Helobdella robusta]ESO01926.1 hypothetical protein HELRODRAFT_161128 [Helobdella robusta]